MAAITNRHQATRVETIQGRAAIPASKKSGSMCDVNDSSPVPHTARDLSVHKAQHEVQKSPKDRSDDCINEIAKNGT